MIDVSFVHDAFEYFKIDFDAVEKEELATLEKLLENYFAEKNNRAEVRFLFKVSFRKATKEKQYIVQCLETIN